MVLNSDDFVTCLITSAYEPIFLALKKLKSLIIVDVSMESATLIVIIYFDDLFEGFKKWPSFNFLKRVLVPLLNLLVSKCYFSKFDKVLERRLNLI